MLYGPFVEGNRREITIPNIQPKIFKCLMTFIYTGFVQIDTDILVPLIQAADQYSVRGAKEEFGRAAQSFMQKATHTDPRCITQVLKLFYDSYVVDIPEILKMCLEFIDQHTVEVLESEAIIGLHKELMGLILKRDSLYDGLEEIQLYLACLRWGNFSIQFLIARGFGKLDYSDEKQFDISGINSQQREDLIEILKNVRLPLIPAEIIIQKIEPSNLIDIHEVYVAMAFQAAPDCFKNDKSDKFRHRYGSEVPWSWSKEHHGPHILLSNNFKTAHGCHYDWEKIVGNVVWRSGIHKFEIQIELNMLASSNTWQIIVGVAAVPQNSPPINLQNHLGSTAKEWGMMCLSGQKINKNIQEDYTQGSRRGDIIGVIVDLNTGRLEFTKNGVSLGIAYENVKGPVSPCISLLKGQKITLLSTNGKFF
ncbi:btb poz domain-containing protein 2 [Stylonychia lemnae]|uniref:Btb poz domain-containing protein 2 n=1 Tax=Stylonychia lemnae TaxID=5949 RepID=A0A078AF28_STYLE|nr:btb poz domain-containing protein 2 [Stylonychia lemnae]|eukprot:CDW80411.1 btb poz domain-containing protein 2 [Stylonychia lemnae]